MHTTDNSLPIAAAAVVAINHMNSLEHFNTNTNLLHITSSFIVDFVLMIVAPQQQLAAATDTQAATAASNYIFACNFPLLNILWDVPNLENGCLNCVVRSYLWNN